MKMAQLRRLIIKGILIISLVFYVSACSRKGTTNDIEDIFKRRCDEYNTKTSQSWDCSDLWSKFEDGFANKGPCGLIGGSYSDYIDSTHIAIPGDKTLFWSGKEVVKGQAMNYSRSCGFVTLSDTLTGCLPDDLQWCGQENEGIDYKHCKKCKGGELSSKDTFWKEASENIAKISTGVVTVMLSGKRKGGAYHRESFFSNYEVPNLEPGRVTGVRILLRDKNKEEYCGAGTILDLESRLRSISTAFRVECFDTEEEINDVCAANIRAKVPQLKQFYPCADGRMNKPITTMIVVSIFLSFNFMFGLQG